MKAATYNLLLLNFFAALVYALSKQDDDGYTGYNLEFEGSKRDVVYDTASTPSNVRH
jgi:hypothetical protein